MSKSAQSGPSLGLIWFIGWLFTLGYLKLGFWRGLLALLVWPYFLGEHFADGTAATAPPPAPTAQVETQ